ncbi:MAG: CvpA family protein [Candidatus Limnocylindria bacterium]
MEVLTELSWVDVAILALLAFGIFLGFTQGIIRYLLNVAAVFVAFIVSAQLKGPMADLLAVWEQFPPEGRELFFFLLFFLVLTIGLWFLIRAFFSRARLPVGAVLDEIGGAIFALAYVVIFISFHLVVLDSFYIGEGAEPSGMLGAYYSALNDSFIVGYLRETVVPAIGYVARPFVPGEIAQLLAR